MQAPLNQEDGPITVALFEYAKAYFFRSRDLFLNDRGVDLPSGEPCMRDYRVIAEGQLNETTSFVYGLMRRARDVEDGRQWEGRIVIDVDVHEGRNCMDAWVVFPWRSRRYRLNFDGTQNRREYYYKRVVIFMSKLFSEPKPVNVPYCHPLHNMIRNYGSYPDNLRPIVQVDDSTGAVVQDDEMDSDRWYESD